MQRMRRSGRRPKVFLGISQAKIAEELGANQSTISRWLRGKTTPAESDLEQIAKLTGLTVSEVRAKIPKSPIA